MPSSPWRAAVSVAPLLALLALSTACSSASGPGSASAGGPGSAPVATQTGTTTVTVIALTDFHGWLFPLKPRRYPRYFGGIDNIAGLIRGREKVDGSTAVIVDNGDMWTGQTEATLLRGEPVVQIYNLLGVAAVNVANHEFDFGQEILRTRIQEAQFPFLSANIYLAGSDQRPDFVKPWTIVARNDVKVGIIGLTFIDTPKATRAKHVADLEFRGYAETLNLELPKLRQAGAEVIVLLLHDEVSQAAAVLRDHPEIKVDLVVAGQNHRKERAEVNGIPITNPGPFGRSYTRYDVVFDRASRRVLEVRDETIDVTGQIDAPPYPPVAEVTAIIERAEEQVKSMTKEVVGRLDQPLPVGTFDASPLGNFMVDSWLEAFPTADFAITNHGGIRQSIASGPVTMGDLLSALPFDNNLVQVKLTGAQLKTQLIIDHPVVGGLTWTYREQSKERAIVKVIDRNGRVIDDNKTYTVIIIDFMYTGGDGYTFKDLDPQPLDTGTSWREPMIRALRRAETAGRALETNTGRRAQSVK